MQQPLTSYSEYVRTYWPIGTISYLVHIYQVGQDLLFIPVPAVATSYWYYYYVYTKTPVCSQYVAPQPATARYQYCLLPVYCLWYILATSHTQNTHGNVPGTRQGQYCTKNILGPIIQTTNTFHSPLLRQHIYSHSNFHTLPTHSMHSSIMLFITFIKRIMKTPPPLHLHSISLETKSSASY